MKKQYFLFQAADSHVTGAPGAVWAQELRAWDAGTDEGDRRDSRAVHFLIQQRLLPHTGIGLNSF